ncbi:MAG: cytochrome-c peroxidase [Wenzhouxiangellaceae bacterium]|nr:cytochrome-c peroxidase [Wenzhouxiangellaceae bacterium]
MHKFGLAILLAVLSGSGVADDALRSQAESRFGVIPDAPPTLEDNALTPEKIELGKMLFFDPRLSASHLISCNTCHNVGMGGHDYLPVSIGHGWQKGPRNSPTVFNAVFNAAQFWDGRAEDLAEQAKGPVQAGVEMASTPDLVVETLGSMPEYVERFERSFPDQDDPLSFDNMARAIEAFEATLITPGSRFDQFVEGDDAALNEQEKKGLTHFIKKGCAGCHGGVNFGGQQYFPFGLVQKPGAEVLPEGDKGRFEVTRTATDEYVFRASPLRNIELTAPYFHSGAVWSLEEAVAVMSNSQLGTELSGEEIDAITAFLETLTGEIPEITYPELPPNTAETPKPETMQRTRSAEAE